MEKEQARQEIRARWRELYPASKDGKGIICPLCGHGANGDGIVINKKSKDPFALKCFGGGCGFAGDAIGLIEKAEGVDYFGALEWGAARLGFSVEGLHREVAQKRVESPQNAPTRGDVSEPGKPPKSRQKALQADYGAYFQECQARLVDPAAISYLQARGISLETAQAAGLGYDPAWVSPTALKRLRERGRDWTPPPTPRIIIPCNPGQYEARDIRPGLTGDEAKYAKQNEGGKGIFNLSALYDEENAEEAVFVAEGAFDALSVMQVKSVAIAINSASNADKLIKQLEKRPTKATLILCLDDDEAGRRAARTIREGLNRLNISHVTGDICNGAKDPNEALTQDVMAFGQAVTKAVEQTAAKPDCVGDYMAYFMSAEIEDFRSQGDIKTGFSNIDAEMGGLYAGLYVVAAISSLGKTTLCHQIADQIAAAGRDVLFFSLEQSRLELVSKSLARITAQRNPGDAVSSLNIRKGYLPRQVLDAADEYRKAVGERLSIVEGNFSCNISFICDYIRRYIRRNGTKPVVFVDYLQILQPEEDVRGRTATTKETVDSTVTALKRLSREKGLTVFVISSVNRASYALPIDFESLKESGGIEYSADVVFGLQLQCLSEPLFSEREKVKEKRARIAAEKSATPRRVQLVCLKNRYGRAGFEHPVCFDYYPKYDLFLPSADKVAVPERKTGKKL